MPERRETTDGRYVQVDDSEWWDTTGIDIVSEAVVDEYLRRNNVGIVTIETVEEETTVH